MPDHLKQFYNETDKDSIKYYIDDAATQLFRDMRKLARGEIPVCSMRGFAEESVKGAILLAKLDLGG